MDRRLFRIACLKANIRVAELIRMLNISKGGFYSKATQKSSFSIPEIVKMREILSLNKEQVWEIFIAPYAGKEVGDE